MKPKNKSKSEKLTILSVLIIMGILGRIALVTMANLETVLVVAILSGVLLGGVYCIIVPITVMVISDLYLYTYNYNYFFGAEKIIGVVFFTWSGFAMAGIIAKSSRKRIICKVKGIAILTGIAVIATIIYDCWTAFGWWYLMYPHTIQNLQYVFSIQIPFTVYHIISTLIFVPLLGTPLIYLSEHASFHIKEVSNPIPESN